MANVLHKTRVPIDYRPSVDTPQFPEVDWFRNPDISAVAAVPQKYWRVGTNPVEEMSQAEKDAVDAADVSSATSSAKASADAAIDGNDGYDLRALAKLMIDELNVLRQWNAALKAAANASTNFATLKSGLLALPNTPDRTLSQAKAAYKNLIAGTDLDE